MSAYAGDPDRDPAAGDAAAAADAWDGPPRSRAPATGIGIDLLSGLALVALGALLLSMRRRQPGA